MIEVEKNFDLRKGDKERLITDAKLLYKKTITDIYYDTDDFSLTTKDFWLRKRNGQWELKSPLNASIERITDQYREIENEKEIAKILKFNPKSHLEHELEKNGYKPFAAIITERESYQKNAFHLDFDKMDFGFTTFEIELMVNDEKEIAEAERKIIEFASEYNLATAENAGKVTEYIRRFRPPTPRGVKKG